ncbi:iron uptake porin [Aerosakkonemataceae cyanobacterium BLCC-F154]|uniref:Iron uptake porin n=1 Tax=Floridaenema fluviatile BLCC-F154 TaxID=3153640 RepID=A0ABV4YE46_9CYAN
MKNLNLSFSLTSAILGGNLLILSPVIGQTNLNSNPIEEASLSNSGGLPLVTYNPESEEETTIEKIEKLYSGPPPVLDDLDETITNVNQLLDVTPGHWAYQALQSLIEKYRCISGSPGRNFNGNRAMTRYEFAAGLNACLTSIRRLIESFNNQFPQKEDLLVIERLQAEFATELKNITAKIDNVEQRVAFIEGHQFSPTTVLRGSANFGLISTFGDRKAVSPGIRSREKLDDEVTLSGAVVLNFDTSFTGKDRLRTQLVAGNTNNFGRGVTGTEMSRLLTINTGNNIRLGTLFYQFPLGKRGVIAIAPIADFPTRIFPAFNPVSSISNFGAESPIYSFAFGGGGVIYYNFTDKLAGGISYLSDSLSNVSEGLFKGQYTVLSQISYTPTEQFGFAFTYGHYYAPEPGITNNITGSKGSVFGQFPFGTSTATSSNAFGLQFTYKISPKLILGGWVSYFNAKAEASPSVSGLNGFRGAQAEIWSWALTAFLADLGKTSSQLSFVFGMPPRVISNDVFGREDRDTSLHFELSYRYPVTDRIFIIPGFLVVTNPEHNAANPPIWVGLIRTSFSF